MDSMWISLWIEISNMILVYHMHVCVILNTIFTKENHSVILQKQNKVSSGLLINLPGSSIYTYPFSHSFLYYNILLCFFQKYKYRTLNNDIKKL